MGRAWTPTPSAFHLSERHGSAPAPSTTWRILTHRGFVTSQPQKRPRSSFVRFEADMPNERWQADITHWTLASGTGVEILNIIDDHSRLLVGSDARLTTKGTDVVASFLQAAGRHGFPASVLTDNAAVFTGAPRGGSRCAGPCRDRSAWRSRNEIRIPSDSAGLLDAGGHRRIPDGAGTQQHLACDFDGPLVDVGPGR
ncbi:hypothetical protein BH20ACT24_BH20ACT24_00800 [soil metagenome]